jgi:serine protease Do
LQLYLCCGFLDYSPTSYILLSGGNGKLLRFLTLFIFLSFAGLALAQGLPDYSSRNSQLWSEFDARPLSDNEKRFLQVGLALEGDYSGLIDGAWGRGSQNALERYSRRYFNEEPLNAHVAALAISTLDLFVADGWDYRYLPFLGLSLLLPQEKMQLVESQGALENWRHREKNITVIANDLPDSDMLYLHDGLQNAMGREGEPYIVRLPERWVTSVRFANNTTYVRSEWIGGTWSTVYIDAATSHKGDFGAITSSIMIGRPADIVPEESGRLVTYSMELASLFADDDQSGTVGSGNGPATTYSNPDGRTPAVRLATGTAFYVNSAAEAITNAHVIENCSSITINGAPATVTAVSTTFDLALIRSIEPQEFNYLTFSTRDVGLNADITIAGYPLHGILGGLNVNRGSISSMKGLGGDETNIQITAPVQPGNSGGPVIDRGGNVVGVVVSKLDVVAVANRTGDIAQNVNFAIRGSVAKLFLQSNGIAYEESATSETLPPEEVAEMLQQATVLIECW